MNRAIFNIKIENEGSKSEHIFAALSKQISEK